MNFKQVDDLASVWCQCGELELRHENYDEALRLLRVSTERGDQVQGRAQGTAAQDWPQAPPHPLQKATALPARRAEYFDGSEPVQNRVYKSLKVWSMLADLEESLGTFQVSCYWGAAQSGQPSMHPTPWPDPCPSLQSTKAVYDRILDLRIATPQIIINYAMFLEEHKYFEESFKVSSGWTGRHPGPRLTE